MPAQLKSPGLGEASAAAVDRVLRCRGTDESAALARAEPCAFGLLARVERLPETGQLSRVVLSALLDHSQQPGLARCPAQAVPGASADDGAG